MGISKALHSTKFFIFKHSPEILTGISILGVATTTVLTINATSHATQILNDLREQNPEISQDEFRKKAIKPLVCEYAPVLICAGATITCIVCANIIQSKRLAALASSYVLTNTKFDEYKEAVAAKLGNKKADELKGTLNEKLLSKNPPEEQKIVVLEDGSDTLIYDANSGRYFRSSIERLRRIEADMNRLLLADDWVSMNDIYEQLKLDPIDLGNLMGFDTANGDTIIFDFGATITDDEKPCIVLNINPHPKYHMYYGG